MLTVPNSLINRIIPLTVKVSQFISQWAHHHKKTANKKDESSITPPRRSHSNIKSSLTKMPFALPFNTFLLSGRHCAKGQGHKW